MDPALQSQLLHAINSDKLVIFSGAGLSMAPPSQLPSAATVAEQCARKHEVVTGHPLPANLHSDLEALAKHFFGTNSLDVMIRNLLDWKQFDQPSNVGHDTLADFLSCGVIEFGISTNFDRLIEHSAKEQGETPFFASIEASEMARFSEHKPFAKIHGCFVRNPDQTIWCKDQLNRDPIRKRIEEWKDWITVNLKAKDIVFVGFWSDWDYLNDALVTCLTDLEPANIIVINPASTAELQAKATNLWNWASGKLNFKHVQMGGPEFLDELRKVFSLKFMERLLSLSQSTFESWTGKTSTPDKRFNTVTNTKDVCAIRRDSCGTGNGQPSREKRPNNQWALLGAMHLLLRDSGAVLNGQYYELAGKRIRVANATGKVLSKAKEVFADNLPAAAAADIVICVGAKEDGTATLSVVRGSPAPSIARPAPSGEWLTEDQARTKLKI